MSPDNRRTGTASFGPYTARRRAASPLVSPDSALDIGHQDIVCSFSSRDPELVDRCLMAIARLLRGSLAPRHGRAVRRRDARQCTERGETRERHHSNRGDR